MNDELTKQFTVDEVEKALFMMGANKALGPNVFTAGLPSSLEAVRAQYHGGSVVVFCMVVLCPPRLI